MFSGMRAPALLGLGILTTSMSAIAHAQDTDLNQSSGLPITNGVLKDISAPDYDGAVKWAIFQPISDPAAFAVFGALAGAGGGALLNRMRKYRDRDEKQYSDLLGGIATGLLVGGAGGIVFDTALLEKVSFETTIQQQIPTENGAHYEWQNRQVGKMTTRVKVGPFYGQVLNIPETTLPLASNNKDAPFIEGQKIVASFLINRQTKKIISWSATSAER